MRVSVKVLRVDMDGDFGDVEGVIATCTRCKHSEESYGTSGRSVRRCLALLRENCPHDESNYYEADDKGDPL